MALGHNSKAVHRAYAKKAQVTLPPLEEYEQKIVPLLAAIHAESARLLTERPKTPATQATNPFPSR
jgi:hypothetical protein